MEFSNYRIPSSCACGRFGDYTMALQETLYGRHNTEKTFSLLGVLDVLSGNLLYS